MAFTSGNSTLDTSNPRTFLPAACFAACCMLSISSFPNFPMSLFPFARHSSLQDRRQLSNDLLFFRREVLLTRLHVDHQQIERAGATMIKVDHPCAAAFAASGPRPSDLSHTARFGDQVPFFGIPRDEIDEGLPFGVVPDILGLADEQRRFRHGDESSCHARSIRHWRP